MLVNGVAILNNDRFLEKCGYLGLKSSSSGVGTAASWMSREPNLPSPSHITHPTTHQMVGATPKCTRPIRSRCRLSEACTLPRILEVGHEGGGGGLGSSSELHRAGEASALPPLGILRQPSLTTPSHAHHPNPTTNTQLSCCPSMRSSSSSSCWPDEWRCFLA